MLESRPVAQVQNPVKAPEFFQWAIKINRVTKDKFSSFCMKNGFSMQDTLDAALLDYMELFARRAVDPTGGEENSLDQLTGHSSSDEFGEAREPQFDPFAGGMPE